MDRHILGTFTNEKDTVKEVKRLINEEGYSSDELALVIDKHSDYDKRLNTLKEIQVEHVEVEDESVWEKIKDTFSFGSYDSQASHSLLEDYGVPHDQAEHYMDALKEGEIILLANSDAPRSTELSEVNEEIVMEERKT
ncbi:MAG: general stress protein [Alkalibacterium sp.]|nr:general stress protein [Alkalibacterium sp.]